AGCHRGTPSRDELLSEGQNQARQFFALAEGADCAQLRPLMARPEGCDEVVRDFKASHSHLSEIEEAKVDGRDAHMVLVTCLIHSAKHDHRWIVRATWSPHGWKVDL